MKCVLACTLSTVVVVQPCLASEHPVVLPCSVVLHPELNIPNARGAALVYVVRHEYRGKSPAIRERYSISIHAIHLPPPSLFGNYDEYEGFAQIPGKISWRFNLLPIRDPKLGQSPPVPPTWAGRIDEISTTLAPATRVRVRLSSSEPTPYGPPAPIGPVVLSGTLATCAPKGPGTAQTPS